ncbi:MAG: microcystin-dependent protein [Candidatus Azotimanducaceae bacterium]|jgi:microcystin-dependent protein
MSAVDNNLVLHLKLDAVREPTEEGQLATVPDVSDNHHQVDVNGSPKLVVDKGFGSCLQFNDSKVDDYLKWTDADDTLSRGLTLSVWIYHEPVSAIDTSVFIRMGANFWMDFQVDANGIVSLQDSTQNVVHASEYPIQPNQWTHVVAVIQSNGEAQLWLSGRPAGKGSMRSLAETKFKSICVGAYQSAGVVSFHGKIAHMRLHGALLSQEDIQRQYSMDRSSVLNIRESSPLEFELWDEQQKSAIYVVGGEISHKLTVAIWNRDAKQRIVQFKALEEKQCNQLELIKAFESSRRVETTATYEQLIGFTGLDEGIKQKIIKLKKEAGTATTYKQLLEFKGIDEDLKKKLIKLKSDLDTSAIYKKFIELKDIDEDLKQKVIKFKDENKTLTELKESLQADFFIRNHHLELRFPRGTLSVKSSKWFQNDLDRQLAKKTSELVAEKQESPAEDSWYIYYQNHPTLNSESLYLLRADDKAQALEFSDEKSAKPALEIILPHITTDPESAGQVLPIELRPGPLARREGPANLILGKRIKTVEVLSQLGQKYIPLHFDVVGSNTVLNDGASETALLLRITNVDREVSIPIHGRGNRQTQFVLACEITDQGGHHEWALTDEKKKITVQIQKVTKVGAVQPKPDAEDHWENDPIQALTNGQMAEWVIDGELLGTHALKPNESVYLRLKVKTKLRSGPSNVNLYYRHIAGYWDGSRACTIQKSPLIFHRAKDTDLDYVGIGTNQPASKLSVTDGLTIGVHWANNAKGNRHKAPLGGLLVEGNVGIGIERPEAKLHIHGGKLRISATTDSAVIELKNNQHSNLLFTDGVTGHLHLGTDSTVHHVVLQTEDTQGNVGIGLNNPSAKLEVNGRIRDQTGFIMPVGGILPYCGTTAPDGWLLCNGDEFPEDLKDPNKYDELKKLIKVTIIKHPGYYEDRSFHNSYFSHKRRVWVPARETEIKFLTPDLRRRTLIGVADGYALGTSGGEAVHQLTEAEMPKHHHAGFGENYDSTWWKLGTTGKQNNPGSSGGGDKDNYYYNTTKAGGGETHNNMQPYYVVNYIIKY